jgi:hypothetical protein
MADSPELSELIQSAVEGALARRQAGASPEGLRTLALAAGELHGTLFRQGLARLKECHGDVHQAARRDLEELQAANIISASEMAQLKKILALLQEGNEEGLSQAVKEITAIHSELIDQRASPVAIAIAGVAANSSTSVHHSTGPQGRAIKWVGIVVGDVMGAIGGANAGKILGPWGAGAGAIIGGAAGSIKASGI